VQRIFNSTIITVTSVRHASVVSTAETIKMKCLYTVVYNGRLYTGLGIYETGIVILC